MLCFFYTESGNDRDLHVLTHPFPTRRAADLIGLRELEPERHRLGMDAVAAPDRGSELVLDRPPLDRLEQCVEIVEQDVARARQLHREAGVEHVRTRHPLMHEARGFADMLGDVGRSEEHTSELQSLMRISYAFFCLK